MNTPNTLAILAASSILVTSTAQAIIVQENFLTGANPAAGEYTVGSVSGQNPTVTGFTGAWNINAGGGPVIESAGLSYSNASGTVASSGGAIAMTNNNSRGGRQLTAGLDDSSSGTYYLSFMYQQASTFSGYRGIDLFDGGTGSTNRTLGLTQDSTNDYELNINAFGATQDNISTIGTDVVFFVMRFDMNSTAESDTFTLYMNPDLANEPSVALFSASGLDISFDYIGLERYTSGSSNRTIWLDEIRMSQDYNEVTTVAVPEPTASAMISGICILTGAFVIRRRRQAMA
ncbi:PEP-CTERM sorting domain-containing protein [Cerasicoccus fimbriatus]|uniref:PEP-CTERM sorting domain-containing protein n=1 Tax=Cerasicoccus fimbriatus TaxID=3014554 RepID=UPI0022B3C59F|nr:PEP-CTERM sorting domain-containing protein [Cerasicoccus sp. TK19100]